MSLEVGAEKRGPCPNPLSNLKSQVSSCPGPEGLISNHQPPPWPSSVILGEKSLLGYPLPDPRAPALGHSSLLAQQPTANTPLRQPFTTDTAASWIQTSNPGRVRLTGRLSQLPHTMTTVHACKNNMLRHTRRHAKTHTHPGPQNHTEIHSQILRYTDTQSHTHKDTLTHRKTQIQIQTHTDLRHTYTST